MPKNRGTWRKTYQPPSIRNRLGKIDNEGDVRMNALESKSDITSNSYYNHDRRNTFNTRDDYAIRRQNSNPFKKSNKNNQRTNTAYNNENWFKITIPHGNKLGKPFIYSSIQQKISHPFNPQYAHSEGNAFIFWIENFELSRQLTNLSMKITTPLGYKMRIISARDKAPNPPELDNDHAEKLKHAMSLRYNNMQKILNLTDFANDTGLKSQSVHLPLFRNNVMKEVIKVIEEHIPDVETIDLSSNKISYLYSLSFLRTKAKNVKHLSLANNQLKSESELMKLRELPLQRLNLTGNPIVKYFDDRDSYISAIRKIFPDLEILDDIELPKVIKFDVDITVSIPKTKPSYYVNEDIKGLVQRFLHQYYSLYDSHDRSELAAAYHDNAYFSMSCSHSPATYTNRKHADLRMYIAESRNLLKVADKERRNKQIHFGAGKIASFLNTLPDTQHDYPSFVVDIVVFTQTFLVFSVTGIFKDKNKVDSFEFIRYFSRTFYAIPIGAGIKLVNDMLYIMPPSGDILKNAFRSQDNLASTSMEQITPTPIQTAIPSLLSIDVAYTGSSSSAIGHHINHVIQPPPIGGHHGPSSSAIAHNASHHPPSIGGLTDQSSHAHLIQTLCLRTGMNVLWSEKCLIDSDWNCEMALDNFIKCHAEGVIPPEAFAPPSL